MSNNLKRIHSKLRKEALMHMFEDLLYMLAFCLMTVCLGIVADPEFISGIVVPIGLVLGASMAIVVYCALIGGSRILSLSVGAMLQAGLTIQALLLQGYLIREEEVLRHAMIVVFAVAAALILVPLFAKLYRSSIADRVADYLPVGVFIILALLLFLSGSNSIYIGGLQVLWPMALMVFCLPVFSLTMTHSGMSGSIRTFQLLAYMLLCAMSLMVVNALDQMVVLTLTVMILAALLLRERKVMMTFLGVIVGVAVGCLLVTWLCSAANHSGMELPRLLESLGRLYDKVALRMDLLFHSGDNRDAGYQIGCVRRAMDQALLLPSADAVSIPAAQHSTTFAALINRLGLLYGLGVLGVIASIFLSGLKICKYASSRAAGGVGMAFLVYLTVNALVSAASTLGLLPTIGLDFPLLSASGTSIVVYAFMLVYLLHLSGAQNEDEEATWNEPCREKIAAGCVLGCCLVIAVACCVMVFLPV